MTHSISECDDRQLAAILLTDGDAEEQSELAKHVETCLHCQQRLKELAAGRR